MSDRDSGGNFAIGFIIGAIAGVAIGFLYAPKAGKETRAILKEKAGEIAESAKGMAGEAKRKLGDKFGHREAAG